MRTLLILAAMLIAWMWMVARHSHHPNASVRVVATKLQIESFMEALNRYHADTGAYPSVDTGLAAIRPYLPKDIPPDAWNRPFIYRLNGGQPVILSLGADGQPGGEGINADIVSWKN